jgi:hypothetical protein
MLIMGEGIRTAGFGLAENGGHRAGRSRRGQPERRHGGIARVGLGVAPNVGDAMIQAPSATTM